MESIVLMETLHSQLCALSSPRGPPWWKPGLDNPCSIEPNGRTAFSVQSSKDVLTNGDLHLSLGNDTVSSGRRLGKRFDPSDMHATTLHLDDARHTNRHHETYPLTEHNGFVSKGVLTDNLSYRPSQYTHGFLTGQAQKDLIGSYPDPFHPDQLERSTGSFHGVSKAQQVLSKTTKPNIRLWNALFEAQSKRGDNEELIWLYIEMRKSDVEPDGHIFVMVVKSCTDIGMLYLVYADIVGAAFESNAFVRCSLLDSFMEFKDFDGAWRVFNKFDTTNTVMWNALISGYVLHGSYEEAFMLFKKMDADNVQPNRITYTSVLKACSGLPTWEYGRLVHSNIIKADLESDVDVCNALVDMYAKCGSLEDAQSVFDRSPQRDVVTWNALLSGYAHMEDDSKRSLQLLECMLAEKIEPDRVTFLSLLASCSGSNALKQGRQIHMLILAGGKENDLFVGNTVINMYARCGSLACAIVTFERLPARDVVTWSVLLAGHVHNEHNEAVFGFLEKMKKEGINPSQTIYACTLKATFGTGLLGHGRDIHAQVIECGFDLDLFLSISLIDMYANCGSLHDAQIVFSKMPKWDVVAWTSLITGFTLNGHGQEAFVLFEQMLEARVEANMVTYLSLLRACADSAALEQGKRIHALMMQKGWQLDAAIITALIDMYGKCGSLEEAYMVFDKLPSRDVMAWSALISGYAEHGHGVKALKLFKQMQQEAVEPNLVTFVCLLKACSSIAAANQTSLVHAQIIECGYALDITLGNALVDAYAKCGNLEHAYAVFHSLPSCDVMTWSSLMKGHSKECDAQSVFQSFHCMQEAGLRPDGVTFVCVLSGCSRSGLLDEGCSYFKSMLEQHGIAPTLEHYNSMVDLLGHVGCVAEAEDLLETLAFSCNVVGWTSLLSSCKTGEELMLGRRCFDNLTQVEPDNGASYVLMSDLCLRAGLQVESDRLLTIRKAVEAWKKPAKAFVEVKNEVHSFMVGDKAHPQNNQIYAKLDALHEKIVKQGYQSGVSRLSGLDKNQRDALCGHSEKLAIAFGLLSTPQGTTIRVTKNLRMCITCHDSTKIISKLEVRQIVVVDTYCIHKFDDGVCSCKCKF